MEIDFQKRSLDGKHSAKNLFQLFSLSVITHALVSPPFMTRSAI